MSQKKLHVEGITNELEGSSLFFNPSAKPVAKSSLMPTSDPSALGNKPTSLKGASKDAKLTKRDSKRALVHASKKASLNESLTASMPVNTQSSLDDNQAGKPAGMHVRMQANQENDYIETIRKSVKKVGREELYVRLTPEEKDELRAVVYQFNELYRRQGGKTSENEVARIALRFLLEEHKKEGELSLLSIMEEALNA